jgi:hypothetical protein
LLVLKTLFPPNTKIMSVYFIFSSGFLMNWHHRISLWYPLELPMVDEFTNWLTF